MSDTCARCGDALPVGAQFCITCGAATDGAATGPTQRLGSPEAEAALRAFAEALRAEGLALSHAQLTDMATGYEHALISYSESSYVLPYLLSKTKKMY